MNFEEMKALVVGPNDILVINLRGDVDMAELDAFGKNIRESRLDLKDRIIVINSPDGIDMAVLKKEKELEVPRSMKGVF